MAAGADRAAFGRYAARLLQSPAAPAFPVDALAPAAYLAGASAGASAYSGKFFLLSSGLHLSLPKSAAALGVSVVAAGPRQAADRHACLVCLVAVPWLSAPLRAQAPAS